ncbi:MAG TPA: FmdE family protein [Pyrinomonadaceae bacterium]|nr:FmdE family protein [Pyrinomonadaceae bacterium]
MAPLDELLKQYELTKGNLCPGSLLGIRMAVLGCSLIGVEDPRGTDQKNLIIWVEIDRWLADAMEVVTGVRLGKRTLKFLDYGKLAATFLNIQTGKAVRIVALELSRRLADQRHPEIESKHARQMTSYREATDDELFVVEALHVRLSEMDAPGHPRSRVICSHCGDGVNDGREVSFEDGSALCRSCAFAAGYVPPFALGGKGLRENSDKIWPVGSIWSSHSTTFKTGSDASE